MNKILLTALLTAMASGLGQAQETSTSQTTEQAATEQASFGTDIQGNEGVESLGAVADLPSFEGRAQAFAAQARVAYPVPFYDRILWKAAVDSAYSEAVVTGEHESKLQLARLYTETQWWVNAVRTWRQVAADGVLDAGDKQLAALSATKMAWLLLQRGDQLQAMEYANLAETWGGSEGLPAVRARLH